MTSTAEREAVDDAPNPIGLDGIEYIEYATSKPQALGTILETMGFKPVARHRSRQILLYRQGPMNVVVNAHAGATHGARIERPARELAGYRGSRPSPCACATRAPPMRGYCSAARGTSRCTRR